MIASLADRILAGDVRAAARLMRDLDDRYSEAEATLRALFPRTGRAWVVGITGSPGAGKSTLTDQLITSFRRAGQTVGVIAVDPTSPFSGGAILGDRIRMQDHATDPGVFIRSLGTRGHLGGLSRSTSELVQVLDAMGKDVILVETVGVGQDEIEIASLAHTVVVVAVPGMGDDVQAIKAGVLEIADIFCVNKADREGADRTVRDLQGMLEVRRIIQAPPPDHGHHHHPADHDQHHHPAGAAIAPAAANEPDAGWEPPIVSTVAVTGEGIGDLVSALQRQWNWLAVSGEKRRREVARARAGFIALLRERLLAGALSRLEAELGRLDAVSARIADREADPYALAAELAARLHP
jgi:LAO/AO transport system kinase